MTEMASEYEVTTVNTADWHNEDSEEIVFREEPDYLETFPPHCMQETEGAEYIDATRPEDPLLFDWQQDYDVEQRLQRSPGDIVIYKDRFDVFEGSPHTEGIVETLDPDTAFVYGVATEVCNDEAVRGLLERGVEVYAVEDAMKGIQPEAAERAKQEWTDLGAELVYTDEVPELMEGSGYQARAL